MRAMRNRLLIATLAITLALASACGEVSPSDGQPAVATLAPTYPPATNAGRSSQKDELDNSEPNPTVFKASALESKGGRIVFSSKRDGNYEIYVMDDTGGNQRRLTNNSFNDIHPAWSPDGTKIVFDSDRNDLSDNLIRMSEIYSMETDGSNQVRLTTGSSSNFGPGWSPDGSRIVFNSERDGNVEIYVMNADGSGQMRLTRNSVVADRAPSWSPDGEKIAFYSTRDGVLEIYSMNPDGSDQIRLTLSDSSDVYPSWSPDGEKIVYSSKRDGNEEIYMMNRDGTNQTRITVNDASDLLPKWSPDGTEIVFSSNRDETREIYVMSADGSNQRRITNAQADWYPSWVPLRSTLDSSISTSNSTSIAPAVAAVVRVQHDQSFAISDQVGERVRITLKHKISNDYNFSDFLIMNADLKEDESLIVHSILFRGDEANPAIIEIMRVKASTQISGHTIRYFSAD